jgi:mono/diheme cytochrome c family protein
MVRVLLAGVFACAAAAAIGAQGTGQAKPGASTKAGAQMFRTYCASCHGVAGRGDGPMAQELRREVPDLTKYTAQNRGVFPRERLRRIIDGMEVAAHGNREMPVWGDGFRSAREGLTPEAARARIDAVVAWLEGIQEQRAE